MCLKGYNMQVQKNSENRISLVKAISRKIGYLFKDKELLNQALTYPCQTKNKPNERLELLGESVLNMIVCSMLYKSYPQENVGFLHDKRRQMVRGDAVAEVGKQIELTELIDRTHATGDTSVTDYILGNAVESLIGAIYLDGGFDRAEIFVKRFWRRRVNEEIDVDYKCKLQEWAMQNNKSAPRYKVVEKGGPSHNPRFVVETRIQEVGAGFGKGGSKKEAEELGAKYLYRATVLGELQPYDVLDSDGDEKVIFNEKEL